MALELILSELSQTPLLTDDVESLYQESILIREIATGEDIEKVIGLIDMANRMASWHPTHGPVSVMSVQFTVAKPYINNALEDDFI